MNPKAIIGLVKDTVKEWGEDKASRLGACLAYYTIFSVGPLLLISVAIASIVFSNAENQIVAQLSSVIGPTAATAIKQAIDNSNKGGNNIIATVIGIVTLVLGASGVFGQLQDALNTIWEVKPKPGRGIMETARDRFMSFTMVLGTGFLLLVVITVMFALLFKFLPDVKIAWKDVWLGAFITALLFAIGQFVLGLYFTFGNVGSAFGAAGSLVIVLVWIYYSSEILFFGAEFTQVYTNKYGSHVVPDENAEFVTEEDRAQQGMTSSGADEREKRKSRERKEQRPRLKASPWFNSTADDRR